MRREVRGLTPTLDLRVGHGDTLAAPCAEHERPFPGLLVVYHPEEGGFGITSRSALEELLTAELEDLLA